MKELTPNYYKKFKCIADKCTHSCCVGWEIDIDEDTLSFYKKLDTPLGERIRGNIDGETPHFVLTEDERCPFLNDEGLCDIITECGDDALCDICRLHPRFRNFFDTFTETGLGLCCEEAVRVVLCEKEKFTVEAPDTENVTDEERTFLCLRNEIIDMLQDRQKSMYDRFCILADKFGFKFEFSLDTLFSIYLSLERLDEKWTGMLEELKGCSFNGEIFSSADFQVFFEQLSCYFVFRHLADGLWYGDFAERVSFSLMSCYLVGALVSKKLYDNKKISNEEVFEIVRMYSSEVEYSEENMQRLLTL